MRTPLTYIREHADRLRRRARAHCRRDDPLFLGCLAVTALAVAAGIWFVHDALHDLPSAQNIRDMGNMSQATTLFDDHDRPAFTIYQERRLEIPLSEMS